MSYRIELGRSCLFCAENVTLTFETELQARAAQDWMENRYERPLVQVAFPDLTSGQRETMVSKCHEACFDDAFGDGPASSYSGQELAFRNGST